MGSTFGGISTALSALYAQRRGMDIAGQNIANVNTDGYSRQRADLRAVGSSTVPARYSTGDTASGGVMVADVTRIRNEFLESRGRAEHARTEYLTGQTQTYALVEQVIDEPSDTGLQSQMSEFWGAWGDLANRPNDGAARTQVLRRAETVTDTLNTSVAGLASIWSSGREQLASQVSEVNVTAAAVAELNSSIVSAKQSGLSANELFDQRDHLVLKLAEMTGAVARNMADGSVNVTVGGSELVSGVEARTLKVVGSDSMSEQRTDVLADRVQVRWTDNDTSAGIAGGAVASSLESLTNTVVGIATSLDGVAASLASTVNAAHGAGWDLNGAAGKAMFSGTTASTIGVAITNSDEIAASDAADQRYGGGNADKIADLVKNSTGTDATYRKFVVDLGVAAQATGRRADIQGVITQQIDASRQSESGVSLDEEMTNMIAFERAYQAAARVLNAVDSALDTLINGTGR